ncbi:MAG: hypothetical protein CM15mP85_19870 [Rhodobacterales bacterium]|nr:MAG: hypothetical protein CM15mP85_19870 [Rhodobacterales bacterium]
MVSFKELVYVPDYGKFKPVDELSENVTKLNISGTELRQRLYDGTEIPDWFSFPEVLEELRKTLPLYRNGFTIFSQAYQDQEINYRKCCFNQVNGIGWKTCHST